MILVVALEIMFIFQIVLSVPMERDEDDDYEPLSCFLPPELDDVGSISFVQDCDTLDRFEIPIPSDAYTQLGIHPRVCCPKDLKKISRKSRSCLTTDSSCPSSKETEDPEYEELAVLAADVKEVPAVEENLDETQDEDEDNIKVKVKNQNNDDTDTDVKDKLPDEDEYYNDYESSPEVPEVLLSNVKTNCQGVNNSTCTSLSRCTLMDELNLNPANLETATRFCSFDEESAELMICCPFANILQTPKPPQKPRFPIDNKPRECEDQTIHCQRWSSNGACALNKTFVTSEIDPDLYSVSSVDMFSFIIKTCLKSCNRCANKGCVDEFASCPQWAKGGYCSSHSFFMTHSCRESCGTCGFLSSLSKEKQIYNKQSYSRISDPDFNCGRYKSFDDLETIGVDVTRGREGADFNETEETKSVKNKIVEEHLSECRNISMEDDPEKVSFANVNSDSNIFCSASIIADRWMITAAHCQDEAKSLGGISSQILRTSFPQFKEYVEVKRTFIHPGYKTGELNSDIALVELGRRVEFKPEEFGDTPICLDKGLDLPGKVATAQGFGKTEFDNGGSLLEINVTLIDTDECIDQLETFFETKPKTKKKFCDTFPLGISDDHICARGIKKEDGIITASCDGDAGGPVFLEDEEGRRNLVGIISGSMSCCGHAPEWYTSIQYNRDWISCILDMSPELNFNKARVEEACRRFGEIKEKKNRRLCLE